MNKEDIIRIALEAGMQYRKNLDQLCTPYCDGVYIDEIEKFVSLVAAAEREACAKMCEEISDEEYYLGRQYADMIRARGDK